MKLEDQVITLQQAQRLKDLGVKQESYFSWYVATDCDDDPSLNRSGFHCPTCGHPRAPYFAEAAAFTVAELGMMLPEWIYKGGEEYRRRQWRNTEDQYSEEEREIGLTKIGYCICYEVSMTHTKRISIGKDAEGVETRHTTEAAARASMLIHLLESKLITAEEVNSRI